MPVSSRLIRNVPSIRPTVGKFWMPLNPIRFNSAMKTGINRNGSVPQIPARTGVSFTIGSTSRAMSTTIAFASPYGIRPESEPRPPIRKRPEL